MTSTLLPLAALLVPALLLLSAVGALAPSRDRCRFVPAIMAAIGTVALLLGAAALAGGRAEWVLPFGLPGVGMTLALDPLSGFFLLPVCLPIIGAGVWALGKKERAHPLLPVFPAGMLLTLLAGDGWTLLVGFELMSLASWALLLAHAEEPESRRAAQMYLGMAVFGGACLVPCFALLHGTDFAAMRADPPDGWRAALVLALALAGAGSKAGLAPLHVWLPPAHAAAPAEVSAMMSAAMTKVALYVLVRVLFDLCGPAQPAWWCVPVLAVGVAGAVLGAMRAATERDLKIVLGCSTVENIGIVAIGLSVALAARAADLAGIAALALGGALLHVLMHSGFKSLLFLGAGSAVQAAGTRRLDKMGGLSLRMPTTTLCVLAGAASLAALPPSAGFASEWTIFQALLSAPRLGALWLQALFAVALPLMALAAALAATAAVRLVGVGFLGRPRSPRAAGAAEAPPVAGAALIGLASVLVLLGLFPGLALDLAAPAAAVLLGSGPGERAGPFGIMPRLDAPGYVPLAVLALLALAACGAVLLMRRRGGGARRAEAWDGGFGAPPPWLPFGDPATQYGALSFGQPLMRSLGGFLLRARERVVPAAPGDAGAARYEVHAEDPAESGLFAPAEKLRGKASERIDRFHRLTIRSTLSAVVATLLLLLALIALQAQQ
jgi:hydrogenase-4 component B